MVRVITQETFDSVVKENIEDLELSPEEAIEDAVKQFQAQVQHPLFF
jgi:armadillo repeat-containing protein 6